VRLAWRLFAQLPADLAPPLSACQGPLGVPALEDKLVQRAVVEVLNAIYEQDFIGFSYGFRSQRSQHQALDALARSDSACLRPESAIPIRCNASASSPKAGARCGNAARRDL